MTNENINVGDKLYVRSRCEIDNETLKKFSLKILHNFQNVANILLQFRKNHPVTVSAKKNSNDSDSLFKIRLKMINDALAWLKQNNPLYKEIVIDQSRLIDQSSLNKLPADEVINVSVRFIDDSQSNNCDRGQVKENEEEIQTSSFIPEKLSQLLKEIRFERSLEYDVQRKCMDIGSVPFNKFSTQCLGVLLAFSSLFPYG